MDATKKIEYVISRLKPDVRVSEKIAQNGWISDSLA